MPLLPPPPCVPPGAMPAPAPTPVPPRDPLFDRLRAQLADHDTPPAVQRHLQAAFARQHAPGQPRRLLRWWQRLGASGWALLGCGASGVLALALLLVVMLRPPSAPDAALNDAGDDSGSAFIALDTLERIEDDPAPTLLTTRVPRASLSALGVAVSPDNAGDMVEAEMLVGADGSPLALRLAPE
ncbi:hypothetical protein [Massilia sp. PWRC2]|uniref:hypothetical protein n=1 Tax=Massilia sp. PWRC2 TaxID=2804626 RepID=UPI003CF49924